MALQANALCSVADITARGVSKPTGVIEDEINSVSDALEAYCRRVFRQVVRVASPSGEQLPPELVAGSGGRLLQLSSYPITAVSAVLINGGAVTDYTAPTLLPELASKGQLYRQNAWPRQVGVWDELTMDPCWQDVALSISVSYTGGFATIPAALKKACIQEVVSNLAVGSNPHLVEERTAGGRSVRYGSAQSAQRGFLQSTYDLVAPYVRPYSE